MSLPSRGERLLAVLTPAVAMAAVALGLRIGARSGVRAAVVTAAPAASAGTGMAWQVTVFDEEQGAREPAPGVPLDVLGREGDASDTWRGQTNADGVAEVLLKLPGRAPVLEVRSAGTVLVQGEANPQPPASPPLPAATGWLPFARRTGPVAMDVALLGLRAAPGFPAELWVRASDAATRAPLARAAIALDSDTSLVAGATAAGTTDSRGWTRIVVTPVGLAVTATLRARAADGRAGEWIGGLFMSPGAPRIEVPERVAPGAPFAAAVTMPTVRGAAYLEIDRAGGRAWAAAPALAPQADGTSRAELQVPALAPGLYWAVAAADPAGAASLGSGTIARPFFVAASAESALGFGADRDACQAPRDIREDDAAVGTCLALAAAAPVPRWIALDGFAAERGRNRAARSRGLAVAVGALAVAIALEALLLARAGSRSPRRTVAVAALVGLLGLALLAAFIVRV